MNEGGAPPPKAEGGVPNGGFGEGRSNKPELVVKVQEEEGRVGGVGGLRAKAALLRARLRGRRRLPLAADRAVIRSAWQEFTPVTKGAVTSLAPMALWCLFHIRKNSKPGEVTTRLLVWYSQTIALYALRNMYIEQQKNIGVRRTFTRSFERSSLVGSLIYTTSLWKTIHTLFGKTYFLFNLLHSLLYAFFVWLSLNYNRGLPHPCHKRERGIIHWPAFVGFMFVMSLTSFVWGKELKIAVLKGDRYNFLSIVGFLMNSFGILRAGLQTAKTSSPAISPFSAASPMAVANTFAALIHIPSFASSPIARVYIMGYMAMTYCLVIIAYLCLRQERAKALRKVRAKL